MQTSLVPESAPRLAQGECLHCGQGLRAREGSEFCCAGCEAVYGLIQANHLGHYYELKSVYGDSKKGIPPVIAEDSFSYLDDPEFKNSYGEKNGTSMRFHLEGVHCAACVWITEKIPTFVPGVSRVTLNLTSALATVELAPGGSFARVAREFARLGYRPNPVELDEGLEIQKNITRQNLLQLGVAGACAGNIMLLAIANYAGAGAEYSKLFEWVSLLLFLPVLTYSARSFFINAFRSIRIGKISIDVPIALGILVGSLASFAGVVGGSGETYFDSLSGLIFLLLSSRYLLSRVQARASDATHLLHFLTPSRARLCHIGGGTHDVRSESLRVGNEIEVLPGEIFPADGTILKGNSDITQSWLTGETSSRRVAPGSEVVAGAFNETASIVLRVTASGAETRLGEILRQTQLAMVSRSTTMKIADRMAEFFVPFTLALVLVGFLIGFETSLHEGFARAMAVAIVACPCALALAIPLTMSLSIGKLAKLGILVRGADVLEKLSHISEVYFDKTGTLTGGDLSVIEWLPNRDALEGILLGLESKSNHPVAKAIRRHFAEYRDDIAEIEDLRETLGRGVVGIYEGRNYSLVSHSSSGKNTAIALLENGIPVGTLFFGDPIRRSAFPAVRALKELGLKIGILSGDQNSVVSAIAAEVDIATADAHSGLSPESKAEFITRSENSLMVGDGVNDSIALASASVGFAVRGGMEASMRAAGIYSASGDLLQIPALIRISRETMKVIRRNLGFTLFYNVGVISVALAGHLSPLFAAVVMPISAFTVYFISMSGTRSLRNELEELAQ